MLCEKLKSPFAVLVHSRLLEAPLMARNTACDRASVAHATTTTTADNSRIVARSYDRRRQDLNICGR